MRLLVIGNGATAVDARGVAYLNSHTADFLRELAEQGRRVAFLQPCQRFELHTNLHDRAIAGGNIQSVTIDKSGGLALLRTLPPALWHVLRADFVYIFYPGALPLAVARLCAAIRKPYGLYLRGQRFSTRGREGAVFRHARFVVTVSPSLAKDIAPLNDRVVPIRPMLELGAGDAVRRDFTRPSDRPIELLFVGRLENAKGVPELIEAAGLLNDRGLSFGLSLIGGGPLRAQLASCYGNRPGANIRVIGQVLDRSELMRAYEAADIVILPTHHEGFPRVLHEAMIKSAVIVTTLVGGIPGLMRDGVNCLAIPVGSPEAIAAAVVRASGDRSLMQKLSSNGLETILTVLDTYPSHSEAVGRQLDV